jgi:type II secretory pathway pseudopilin PulG
MSVVMAIIAILAALAGSTLLRSQPRTRVRGDSWAIYQALTKAKFLTINENRPYGVAFLHQPGANPQDVFFVFRDMNTDQVYDDTDGNPLVQCNPAYVTGCAEDPIYGDITPLSSSIYFRSVLGNDMTVASKKMVFITFTNLGTITQIGTFPANTILLQSTVLYDIAKNTSYQGGIRLDMAAGTATRLAPVPCSVSGSLCY